MPQIDTAYFSRTRIEVYNQLGGFKTFFQLGFGPLADVKFTHDETGARDFSLLFSKSVNIVKKDIIKIHIPDSDNPDDYLFFKGVVREIPIPGSTKMEFRYSGYGFNDFLTRINTESQSYSSTNVRAVIIDLLDNIIVPKTPIVKDLSKINTDLSSVSITSLVLSYVQIPEVLDQLKNIANSTGDDYIIGVDYEGDFFFEKRSTTELYSLFASGEYIHDTNIAYKGQEFLIPAYDPKDTFEAITKIFVKKKDGTYYKTLTAATDNEVNEIKVVAPDIAEADIDNWAEGILKESEVNKREAQINWGGPQFLIADGTIRITSYTKGTESADFPGSAYGDLKYGDGYYGGAPANHTTLEDVLKIKEVTYTIDGSGINKQISLGALPIELDREILNVREKLFKLQDNLGL